MVISQLIPFANNQGISSATIATHGSGRGSVRQCLRPNSCRLAFRSSGQAQHAASRAGDFQRRHARAVLGRHACGRALRADFCCVLLLRHASLRESGHGSDFCGTSHAGTNYGVVFTAWGFAGILGPTIGGVLFDSTETTASLFIRPPGLAIIALICILVAQDGRKFAERVHARIVLRCACSCISQFVRV